MATGRWGMFVLVALIAMGVLPGAASASSALVKQHLDQTDRFPVAHTELVFRGVAGEANQVVVALDNTGATLIDSVPITVGPGCVVPNPAMPNVARCALRFSGQVPPGAERVDLLAPKITADLGDQNDSIAITGETAVNDTSLPEAPSTELAGGSGNDTLRGTSSDNLLDGGPGNDRLIGGDQSLNPNSGDTFVTNRGPDGRDTFIGNGGPLDEVDYSTRRQGVRASLNGKRDDGARGEHDRISSDIHTLFGSAHADRLRGSSNADTIGGNGGADRISGGGGDDKLTAGGRTGARIDGGSGADLITGSAGPDRIDGGPGRDDIGAGSGADRINTRDRSKDKIDCGRGRDRISIDSLDTFARCEVVRRRR